MAKAFGHVPHYARRIPNTTKRIHQFALFCLIILNMNEAEAIIAKHGGGQALAEKMGLPAKWLPQRLHYWKKHGIPAATKLAHPELFLSEDFLLAALEKVRARAKEEMESKTHG